jgi:hypothetical protein
MLGMFSGVRRLEQYRARKTSIMPLGKNGKSWCWEEKSFKA